MRNIEQREAVQEFLQRGPIEEAVLTLGGSGPNGSTQVAPLAWIGGERLARLHKVNVLSASSYAYLIHYAYERRCLKVENYLGYDRLMRRLHHASLLKGLLHFGLLRYRRDPLYRNSLIKGTTEILFAPEISDMPLGDLPANVRFWSFCSTQGNNVELSSETYPDMRVWQAISACVSLPFVHGEFCYGSHRFSDANYGQRIIQLKRQLVKDRRNHLYFNYKRSGTVGSLRYVQNQSTRLPDLRLGLDMAMLLFNIPNHSVDHTSRYALEQMRREAMVLEKLEAGRLSNGCAV